MGEGGSVLILTSPLAGGGTIAELVLRVENFPNHPESVLPSRAFVYMYIQTEAARLKTACICTFTSCLFYSDGKFAGELFTFSSCRLYLLSEVVQFK